MTPKQIRKLRSDLNMSLRALAAECHVSPQTIHNWTTGKRRPDVVRIAILRLLERRAKMFKTAVDRTKTSC
jgi:DNA-binding transcriptional regulator YiaG